MIAGAATMTLAPVTCYMFGAVSPITRKGNNNEDSRTKITNIRPGGELKRELVGHMKTSITTCISRELRISEGWTTTAYLVVRRTPITIRFRMRPRVE